jgi:hypothetical protein
MDSRGMGAFFSPDGAGPIAGVAEDDVDVRADGALPVH